MFSQEPVHKLRCFFFSPPQDPCLRILLHTRRQRFLDTQEVHDRKHTYRLSAFLDASCNCVTVFFQRILTYITSIYHKKIYSHMYDSRKEINRNHRQHIELPSMSLMVFLSVYTLTSNKRYKNKRKTHFRVF